MKSVMTNIAASLVVALLLSACVLGSGKTSYRLIAPQVEAPPQASSRADIEHKLAIARPEADRTRDSARILVRRDRTLLPWTDSAWIDRSPDLLQDLLVGYLDGTVATVGRYGSLPGAYRLDLVMRRFEFVEGPDGLQAELVLVARLFSVSGELLDVTTLSRRESVGGDSIDPAVSAMETAMQSVFGKLADWLRPRLESAAAADQ